MTAFLIVVSILFVAAAIFAGLHFSQADAWRSLGRALAILAAHIMAWASWCKEREEYRQAAKEYRLRLVEQYKMEALERV